MRAKRRWGCFPKLLLVGVLCAWASPCAWGGIRNPDTLTYLGIGDVDSLDPAWSYDGASHLVIANLYEYLFAFKEGSVTELEGAVAQRVPTRANGLLSADGTTYAIGIRKGLRFHDGEALTPEDVRYSLLRFMLVDRDGGPSSLLLEPVLGVLSTRDEGGRLLPGLAERAASAVRVEAGRVVVRLPKPFAPLPAILANYPAVVSKGWCIAHGGWDGSPDTLARFNNPKRGDAGLFADLENGSGPYRLDRLDRAAKEVRLAGFDGYRRGAPALKRVVLKSVEEFATRRLALLAGDADVIYAPQLHFTQLQGADGVELIDGLENLERGVTLLFTFKIDPVANPNVGSGRLDGAGIPPGFFADRDVRKAFSYAIDYEAYVKDVLRGKGRPARGYIPKGLPGHDPAAPPYAFDLAKAAEHLRKAWGGRAWEKGFKLTLVFNDNQPAIQALAGMLKRNIESLNPRFRLDVRSVQWSTFLSQSQAKKIPLFTGAWHADYPDPHNFAFPLLHSKGYFGSKTAFADARFDELIEKASRELDPRRREGLYRKLERLAREEVPSIPIADGLRYRTQRSWVKGYRFNPVFPDAPYGSSFFELRKEE